jgi:hypothetical protein
MMCYIVFVTTLAQTTWNSGPRSWLFDGIGVGPLATARDDKFSICVTRISVY